MNNDKVRRFSAYCLDLLIITLISSGLFEIKALHPNADKYEAAYTEYNEYVQKVNEAGKKKDTKEEGKILVFFDNDLNEEDLKKIDNISKVELINKSDIKETDDKVDNILVEILDYFESNELTKAYVITIKDSALTKDVMKEINKLDNIIDVQEYEKDNDEDNIKALEDMTDKEKEEYFAKSVDMLHKVNYYGISYNVCLLVVVICYFTLFPYFNSGMTIGKRVVKLKIVRSDDENKKVALWQYFVKAVLCPLYGTGMLLNSLTYVVMIITPLLLKGSAFAQTTTYVSLGICALCYIDLFMIAFRKDKMGYSDKLAKVKVVNYVRD